MKKNNCPPIVRFAVFVVILSSAAGAWAAAKGKPDINRDAYAMARLLQPETLSSKVGKEDFTKAKARLVTIIEILERTNRTSGPRPQDLLETAYDKYVPGMNEHWKLESKSRLIRTWEEAHALGAFDKEGKFSGKITRGIDTGKECVFEYIVPPDKLPLFSTEPANIRIVTPSRQRVATELDAHDQATLVRLGRLGEMVVGARAAQSKESRDAAREAIEPWKREMEEAGEAANAAPSLRFAGRTTGTPSKSNGERYRVGLEITNQSRHPTEVTVEYYFLGVTGEKRKHYRMGQGTETLRLRANEVWNGEFYSKAMKGFRNTVAQLDDLNPKNKKDKKKIVVKGRGWVARVMHNGEAVATAASMKDLLRYAGDGYGELTALP